ncbi:hypothetical protein [Caulobacter sp. 17J80-11]|uniref:hypothetical protein n=1 Tax=Caulobacter sp. 17J80-11 TaxID=2763502 RepID=UPI0016536911|nr:hypothetical protein [Caulobacter sp. 17J80-11]MBC6982019.1 hypothetical protein [Caulobacter sp. 17J80-11]
MRRGPPAVRANRALEQHRADVAVLAEIADTYVKIACKLIGAAVVAWAASRLFTGRVAELDPWWVAGGGGAGALLWLFGRLTDRSPPPGLRPRERRRS